MARSLVGMAALAALLVVPGVVKAEPTAPRVNTTRTRDGATMTVREGGLMVSQSVTRQSFTLTVQQGADRVRITGDTGGRVSLSRRGRSHAFVVSTATAADAAKIAALVTGSAALGAFDALMASSWARRTEAAPFVSAHAIVALLRSDVQPTRALVQRARAAAGPRLIAAQFTASQCWRSYERDVIGYTYELESCLEEASYSLNPLRTMWCSYSYNLQTTLAFIWLLDCSGH